VVRIIELELVTFKTPERTESLVFEDVSSLVVPTARMDCIDVDVGFVGETRLLVVTVIVV
jgi:hypothetical protein